MDILGNKKRQQELLDKDKQADEDLRRLIESTLQGDLEAGEELRYLHHDFRAKKLGIADRLEEAKKQHDLNQNFARYAPAIQEYFQYWQRDVAAGNLEAAAASFAYLQSKINELRPDNLPLLKTKLKIDMEAAQSQFVAAIQKRYDLLIKPAAQSRAGLNEMRNFIEAVNCYRLRACQVNYPDNWNDLVVRFIDQPTIKDFVGLDDFSTHQIDWLNKAGDAKARKDVSLAKQVIAVYIANRSKASAAMSMQVSALVDMLAEQRSRV